MALVPKDLDVNQLARMRAVEQRAKACSLEACPHTGSLCRGPARRLLHSSRNVNGDPTHTSQTGNDVKGKTEVFLSKTRRLEGCGTGRGMQSMLGG